MLAFSKVSSIRVPCDRPGADPDFIRLCALLSGESGGAHVTLGQAVLIALREALDRREGREIYPQYDVDGMLLLDAVLRIGTDGGLGENGDVEE